MKKIIGVLFISTILVCCSNNNKNEVSNDEPTKQSNSNSSEVLANDVTSETAESNESQALKMNEDLILVNGDEEQDSVTVGRTGKTQLYWK